MNNQPIVRLRSLRVNAGKHLSSNNALFLSIYPHQSGAVLIISLIMLLLLTLIGASSIQTTSLEEKMAGNKRDENLAFQAAETVLRAGEARATTLDTTSFSVANNGTGSTGLYTTVNATLPDPSGYWKTVDWGSDTAVATYAGSLNYVNKQPRYIIEELPTTESICTNTGGSLEFGLPDTSVYWYRITARGTGASDNAVVRVQSIFKKCQ